MRKWEWKENVTRKAKDILPMMIHARHRFRQNFPAGPFEPRATIIGKRERRAKKKKPPTRPLDIRESLGEIFFSGRDSNILHARAVDQAAGREDAGEKARDRKRESERIDYFYEPIIRHPSCATVATRPSI